MAVLFDAASSLALGTGDRSWTHTPVGTPKGVLVIIVDGVTTDQVVGVTYGGTSMTQVPTHSPKLQTGGEGGSVHAFWLGSSVPTGAKSVAIDRGDATNYIAACYTVTAIGDTYIHSANSSTSTSTATPGATLTITEDSFVAGGLYSGLNSPGSTAVSGTSNTLTGDFGTDTAAISRGTSIKTSNFSYTWSQTADDGTTIVVALADTTKLTYAQAQTDIKTTYRSYAQALADIQIPTAIYKVVAQAQTQIKSTYRSYAQAKTSIKQTYPVKIDYSATVLADSPAGYWRLGDKSGVALNYAPTTAPDLNAPTLNRAQPGLIANDPDGSIHLDRADDNGYGSYLANNVASNGMPAGSSSGATIEGWIKWTAITDYNSGSEGYHYIASWSESGANQTSLYWRYADIDVTHLHFDFYDGTSGREVYANWKPVVGEIYHIVGVIDAVADLVKIYVNGTPLTISYPNATGDISGWGAFTPPAADSSVWVGGYPTSSAENPTGYLDEVAFYPSALTATQVSTHYTNGTTATVGSTFAQARAWIKTTYPAAGDFRTYPDIIVSDNPAGYWRLGEPSGNPQDSVGTNHVTSTIGTPAYSTLGALTGDSNKSITFVGAQAFNVPDATALDLDDTFSIEAWIKRGSQTENFQYIVSKSPTAYGLQLRYGRLVLRAGSQLVMYNLEATAITDTEWHHVVGTKNGAGAANARVYIDGVDVSDDASYTAGTVTNNTEAFTIGAESGGGQEFFSGAIDEVAVYDHVLTPTQVASHYAAAVGKYVAAVKTDSPVAYWRLGEPSGSTYASNEGDSALDGELSTSNYTGFGVEGAIANDTNTALTFTGDNYLTVADNTALDTGDTFTLECWVKRSVLGAGAGDKFLISKGANSYRLGFNNDGIEIAKTDVAIIGISTVQVLDRDWHHIVWTKSGSTNKIYLDGEDVTGTITNQTIENNALSLYIGRDDTDYFTGTIDETAIYSTALSANQVQAHYAAGIGEYAYTVKSDSPVGYWRLGENNLTSAFECGFECATLGTDWGSSGTAVFDSTIAGRTGTNAVRMDISGTGASSISTWTGGNDQSKVAVRLRFRLSALPTAAYKIFKFNGKLNSDTYIVIESDGYIGLTAGGTYGSSPAGTIAVNQWYTLQFWVDGTARTSGWSLDGVEMPAPGSPSFDEIFNGFYAGKGQTYDAGTHSLYVDDVVISHTLSDYPIADGYINTSDNWVTYAEDEIGTNDGTYVNTPTLGISGALTGDSNTAVTFASASTEYVSLGSSISFNSSGWSVEFWWKQGGSGNRQLWYIGGAADCSLQIQGGGEPYVYGYGGSLACHTTSAGYITDDNWHLITVTKDGSNVYKIYVDGTDRTVSDSNLAWTTGSFAFQWPRTDYEIGGGSFDDVAIYNYALISEQVLEHYTTAKSKFVVGDTFAQAQAKINAFAVQSYAQAQATLNAVNSYRGYAQAQVHIKTTYRVYAQGQTQVKTTYRSYAQAQTQVKQTYRGYAQGQVQIRRAYLGHAQGQAQIKQTYKVVAQAQVQVRQTYKVVAQAQAQIKNTYRGYAQAKVQIRQTYPHTALYSQTIISDSPVGYWRLGESSGNPQDSSGNNNHVTTVAGTPTYGVAGALAGDGNTAIAFNGTTDYFSVTDHSSLDMADVFTMEAWINRGAIDGSRGIISKGSGAGYLRVLNNGNLTLNKTNYGIIVQSTITVPTGWHHVVGTKNGSDVHLYIDGVDVTGTVTDLTCWESVSPLYIGAAEGSIEFNNGSIDEAAVYNYALTPAQIAVHYQVGQITVIGPTFAQAQTKISTTRVHAQAQAKLKSTYTQSAQVQATLRGTVLQSAQALADIKQTYPLVIGGSGGTLIVYSDLSDGYIHSSDGEIEGYDGSYSIAREGTGGFYVDTDLSITIGQYGEFTLGYHVFSVWEGFLSFDTSSLSGSTISEAILNLCANSDSSSQDFTIEARLNDWGTSLTTADWVAGSNLSSLTLLGSYDTSSGWTFPSRYNFSDIAMSANINKTGTTRLLLCSSRTTSNIAPSTSEYVATYSANSVNDPKLTITYSGSPTIEGPTFAQAQTRIKQTYQVVAQAQSQIKNTYKVVAQANAQIKQTYQVVAQAQTKIATTRVHAQAQAQIKQVYRVVAQAQTQVKTTYRVYAQARPHIKRTYRVVAQAQVKISTTRVHAQAGALLNRGIKTAQATVLIDGLYHSIQDTFTRTVADGWGTANIGGDWTTVQTGGSTLSVDGTKGVVYGAAYQQYSLALRQALLPQNLQFTIDFQHNVLDSQLNIDLFSNSTSDVWGRPDYTVTVGISTQTIYLYDRTGTTIASYLNEDLGVSIPSKIEIQVLQTSTEAVWKIRAWELPEVAGIPSWQIVHITPPIVRGHLQLSNGAEGDIADGSLYYDNLNVVEIFPQAFGLAETSIILKPLVYAQSQAQIKNTYTQVAQSQAQIRQTYQVAAQSQAQVRQTYRVVAQAQSTVRQTYYVVAQAQTKIATTRVHAQAQTDIKQTYKVVAQSNAYIRGRGIFVAQANAQIRQTYKVVAQAQTDIKTTYRVFAQANVWIKVTGNVTFAQARTQIRSTYTVQAQAQADIKTTYYVVAQANAYIRGRGIVVAQVNADIKQTYTQVAQSQTDIKATYTVVAQARTWLKVTGNVTFAQAQADIKQTYKTVAQAQAKIFYSALQAYAQSNAQIKQTYYSVAQANTSIILSGRQGYAQALADIKQTYTQVAQAQTDIKATYAVFAQARPHIKGTYAAVSQAQTQVKTSYSVVAQASVWIKSTQSVFAQANTWIKINVYQVAQARTAIKTTYTQVAQAQAKLNAFAVQQYAQSQAWLEGTNLRFAQAQAKINAFGVQACAQSQADIKQVYHVVAQAHAQIRASYTDVAQAQVQIRAQYIVSAQALAQIKQTYKVVAQANAWIKQTYQAYAQGQTQIKAISFAYAQAQARVLQTYSQVAQAQAQIKQAYQVVAQAQTWIKTTYQAYAQAQATVKASYVVHAQAQAKIYLVVPVVAQAQAFIISGKQVVAQAQAQIKVTTQIYAQANAWIGGQLVVFAQAQAKLNAFAVTQVAQANVWIKRTYVVHAQAGTIILAQYQSYAQANATIRQTYISVAQAQTIIKQSYTAQAQAQAALRQSYVVVAQAQAKVNAYNVQRYAQAQTSVKFDGNAVFAQAQAKINAFAVQSYGQALADIKQTYRNYAQALADIKTTYQVYAQANAKIVTTYTVHAQAQAAIKSSYQVFAQAQARILKGYQAHAQAIVQIKRTNETFAQAQTTIILSGQTAVAQVQAHIKSTYQVYAQARTSIKTTYQVYASAQALITTYSSNYGQSQAWIRSTYNVHAQAIALITASSLKFAQANAYIKLEGLTVFAQAQAVIIKSTAHAQALALIYQPVFLYDLELSDTQVLHLEISDLGEDTITDSNVTKIEVVLSDIQGLQLVLTDIPQPNIEVSDRGDTNDQTE